MGPVDRRCYSTSLTTAYGVRLFQSPPLPFHLTRVLSCCGSYLRVSNVLVPVRCRKISTAKNGCRRLARLEALRRSLVERSTVDAAFSASEGSADKRSIQQKRTLVLQVNSYLLSIISRAVSMQVFKALSRDLRIYSRTFSISFLWLPFQHTGI